VARPSGSWSGLDGLVFLLALLTSAGFSGPEALRSYRAFFGFLNGHMLNELQELVENPDETDDLLRLGVHRLLLSEFPLLRSCRESLRAPSSARPEGEVRSL
jgi:hypothetical protein